MSDEEDDLDIFDELEENSSQPDLAGGLADWWDVGGEDPEKLVGVIVEIHSEPDTYVDDGDMPDPVYTLVETGKGGFVAGQARCTKTHAQVVAGLQNAELHDLVNIHFQGYTKMDGGNMATDYEIGIVKESDWRDSSRADELEELIESYTGQTGDNTNDEPYSAADGPGSAGDGGGSSPSTGSSEGESAGDFLLELVGTQNGEMDVEQADKMLEVRDYDEDLEDVAAEVDDIEVGDGVVRVA